MKVEKHGNHDQSTHGHHNSASADVGKLPSTRYEQKGHVDAGTMVKIASGGEISASNLVEFHNVPQEAFAITGSWMPSGEIRLGRPFNVDGSQGDLVDPHWKSGAWKLQNWGKRVQPNDWASS